MELQVARRVGLPRAESLIDEEDAVYGPGLRMCLQLEERLGREGLLDFVRTHASFPLRVHLWEAVSTFMAA